MADYPDWTRLFWLFGTTITIPINIETSDVILPITIVGATATIDVNLESQDANITFTFADQSVAVFDAAKWFAHTAAQWSFYNIATVSSGDGTTFRRTVPTDKVAFVCGVSLGYRHVGASAPIAWLLRISGVNIAAGTFDSGGSVIFDVPFRGTVGQHIDLMAYNYSGESRIIGGSFWGYDEVVEDA